jgi:predicted RNA-binding Zn ribbon-like protein
MPGTPAHAELLADYANTADAPDRLTQPEGLVAWLAEHDLVATDATATPDDAEIARRLRDRLRDAMESHVDGPPTAQPDLDELSRDLPLHVSFTRPQPTLTPVAVGVRGGLAALLAAVVETTYDGSWQRLKLCRAHDCRYAFHDESKNHSRAWCAMQECGNRAKTRAYRRRRRDKRP